MAKNLKEKKIHESGLDLSDAGKSRAEYFEFGRSLREKTPRIGHAGWRAPAHRRDPVDILIESSEGREPNLVPIRYGRMLQSPFAFFRGAASIMSADLSATPYTGVYVQACGDCHLVNFGTFATPERRLLFDINDFDETLPAPWEWDLKRLAASFVVASLHNNITVADAQNIAQACVQSYRQHIKDYAGMSLVTMWYSGITADDLFELSKSDEMKKRFRRQIEKAKNRMIADEDFPKLVEIKNGKARIKDNPPLIYHYDDLDFMKDQEAVEEATQHYMDTLGDEKRLLLSQFKLQDFAAKVVGVGSVGTRCGISLRMTPDNEPLFLQIKEARVSVLESYAGKSAYGHRGQRVVNGQRLMQAASDMFLGWTEDSNGRHYYVRQLRDMKIKPEVEIFDAGNMERYAVLCGWTLARAHARSCKAPVINGYLGNSSKFDEAIAEFAVDYAEQNEEDYEALREAVRQGKVEAYFER